MDRPSRFEGKFHTHCPQIGLYWHHLLLRSGIRLIGFLRRFIALGTAGERQANYQAHT